MAEIPPVNGKARFSFTYACSCAAPRTCAQRHERLTELFRFPIEGVEWSYRVLSKAPPAHTRPLCRLPLQNCPQNVAQLDVHATHFLRTTRPTWFRTRYPLSAIRLGRTSSASIAALLATYLLRDRAFPPLGARLS